MRQLALSLLLVPALLLALPAPLHAGDDDDGGDAARLERRVEMLLDLVADLHAEVLALRDRVAKLEAERDAEVRVVVESGRIVEEDLDELPDAPTPKQAAIPATPIVPMPIVRWADVSGVYEFDKEASVAAILKLQLEGVEDEEMAEMIRQNLAGEFAGVAITLRMEPNGTFFVRVEGTEEDEESTARGTWKRDESHIGARQRLLFVTTHEDGVEDEEPTQLVATWEDGRLALEEDDDGASGFVMIFRRK